MTIEKNYIVADDNKFLHRKDSDIIVTDVFLGKFDSIENWEEITKEEAEKIIESYKKAREEEAKAEEAKAKAIIVESNSL